MSEPTSSPKSYLSFDGKDDFVALPALNIDWSQGLTVEAWVRHEAFHSFARICDFSNGAANANIVICNMPGRPGFLAQVFAGAGTPHLLKEDSLELGVWTHLAVTIERPGLGKLYKNGKLLLSGPLMIPDSVHRTLNYLGRSAWSNDGYFQGQLADVRVWKVPRSQADIERDLGSRPSGQEPDLVAYLPLDDGEGSKARDCGPNALHGTVHGATWGGSKPAKPDPQLTEILAKLAVQEQLISKLAAQEQLVSKLAAQEQLLADMAGKLAQLLTRQDVEDQAHAALERKLDEQLRLSLVQQELLGQLPQSVAAKLQASVPAGPGPAESEGTAKGAEAASAEPEDAAATGKRRRSNILWR